MTLDNIPFHQPVLISTATARARFRLDMLMRVDLGRLVSHRPASYGNHTLGAP